MIGCGADVVYVGVELRSVERWTPRYLYVWTDTSFQWTMLAIRRRLGDKYHFDLNQLLCSISTKKKNICYHLEPNVHMWFLLIKKKKKYLPFAGEVLKLASVCGVCDR